MKRSILGWLKVGQRTWKDLKKIQVATVPAAGSVSFAFDSVPQLRPSEIHSVIVSIVSQKPLHALIIVRSQAQEPLATT